MTQNEIEEYILKQACAFSANQRASLDDFVYRNLNIERGDAVEFYENIENMFNISLRSITETSVETAGNWLRKPRYQVVPRDVPLREIAHFVIAKIMNQNS